MVLCAQEPSDLGDKKQLENATWFAKNFGFLVSALLCAAHAASVRVRVCA